MKIYCNWQPRELVPIMGVPYKHLPQFDYVKAKEEDQDRFVLYRGQWYDVGDVQSIVVQQVHHPLGWGMVVEPFSLLAKFHAIAPQGFFSGVLFKFVPDNKVIVATYTT